MNDQDYSEYPVFSKYEIARMVRDEVSKGRDFLYLVGTRDSFTEMYNSINFIRSETQQDVIVDLDFEITPLIRTVTLRWNVKNEQTDYPHLGS
jgi:hypothetical protein